MSALRFTAVQRCWRRLHKPAAHRARVWRGKEPTVAACTRPARPPPAGAVEACFGRRGGIILAIVQYPNLILTAIACERLLWVGTGRILLPCWASAPGAAYCHACRAPPAAAAKGTAAARLPALPAWLHPRRCAWPAPRVLSRGAAAAAAAILSSRACRLRPLAHVQTTSQLPTA